MLTIIGLGVVSGDLSLRAIEEIKMANTVVLRTEKSQSAQILKQLQIDYVALDFVYDKSRSFNTLKANLVKEVSQQLKNGNVCYLVDGAVSEDLSAGELLKKYKNAKVIEGVSKAKHYLSLASVTSNSFSSFSAYEKDEIRAEIFPIVIYDVDSQQLMSDVKLKLSDLIGDEAKVSLYVGNQLKNTFVYELDRFDGYDYSTAIIIEEGNLIEKKRFTYNDLYLIVKKLRAPNGCPWDRAQTKESIRKNLIEECYELCDAIDCDSDEKMLEELGDVLLQVVFHVIMAEEKLSFTQADVISDECKKLIFRHSHIFGNDNAKDSLGALDIWDKNKQIEKGFNAPEDYVSDVPKCFPSLLRAQKVLKRIFKTAKCELTIDEEFELLKKLDEKVKNLDANALSLSLLLICDMLLKSQNDAEESLYFQTEKLVKEFIKNKAQFFNFASFIKESGGLCK